MSTTITPTVGRVVWFYPATNQATSGFTPPAEGEPLAAIIARVVDADAGAVHLAVFDGAGVSRSEPYVKLVQEGEKVPADGRYATWMPYQIGQAKKHGNELVPIAEVEAVVATLARQASGSAALSQSNRSGLSFGTALMALKTGQRVAREGWNGKGMWISLSGSTTNPRNIAFENFWSKNASEWARTENGGGAEVLPCILMKTADNRILMGWLASQTDMLAEDWQIVE